MDTDLPSFDSNECSAIAVRPQGKELLKRGLSHLHEALADYMLINPGCTLREMGHHFGYTGAWLCTVINTDMFKAYMAARREEVNAAVAEDLPAKLRAAAHLATERVIEILDKTDDSDTILSAFDKVLHRYGYAPNARPGTTAKQGANVVQNNVFYLSKNDMKEVKQSFIDSHSNAGTREELNVLTASEVGAESG